jgi:hypothetical protein
MVVQAIRSFRTVLVLTSRSAYATHCAFLGLRTLVAAAVVACALHRVPGECGADARVLQLVGDLDGEVRDLCSLGDIAFDSLVRPQYPISLYESQYLLLLHYKYD